MPNPLYEWYPSALAPHMYYIDGRLSGMAAALQRERGATQKWEAYDVRKQNAEGTGSLFLGEYESIELAKLQIEKMVVRD